MAIWIKLFGGRKVKRVIERTLPTPADARAYLSEWGISGPTKAITGTYFTHSYFNFSLSHTVEDIFTHDSLEDNTMSKFMGTATTSPRKSATKVESPKPAKKVGQMVCLKEICRDIDMDPRVARQKLRKLNPDNGKQRWEWSKDEVDSIKAKLQGGK